MGLSLIYGGNGSIPYLLIISSIFLSKIHLTVSSINQQPYENPLNSKLLIADNRQIILFKQFPDYVESDSLFVFNKSTVRKVRILTEKNTGGSIEILITKK